jgi:hypothetical protein
MTGKQAKTWGKILIKFISVALIGLATVLKAAEMMTLVLDCNDILYGIGYESGDLADVDFLNFVTRFAKDTFQGYEPVMSEMREFDSIIAEGRPLKGFKPKHDFLVNLKFDEKLLESKRNKWNKWEFEISWLDQTSIMEILQEMEAMRIGNLEKRTQCTRLKNYFDQQHMTQQHRVAINKRKSEYLINKSDLSESMRPGSGYTFHPDTPHPGHPSNVFMRAGTKTSSKSSRKVDSIRKIYMSNNQTMQSGSQGRSMTKKSPPRLQRGSKLLGVSTLLRKSQLGYKIKAQKTFNDRSSILKNSDDGPESRTTRILSSRDCDPMSNEYRIKSSRLSLMGGGNTDKSPPIVQFAKVNSGRESDPKNNVGS